jgi:hypothetical protein
MSDYISTHELAKITGISASTWNKRRFTGDTPPYLKIEQLVRYHLPTVKSWLAARERRSISELEKAA